MSRKVKDAMICLLVFALMLLSTVVWAACTTSMITTSDGRVIVCQRCCDSSGNCSVICN